MKIDRSHIPWALLTIVATVILTLGYMAQFHPERLPFSVKLPALFRSEQSGFTHDAKVLGGVVLGNLEPLGNLIDAECTVEKEAQHAKPRLLAESF